MKGLSRLELERLRVAVADKLVELEKLYVSEMRITYIARLPGVEGCHHVVTSDDDLRAVAEIVTAEARKEEDA